MQMSTGRAWLRVSRLDLRERWLGHAAASVPVHPPSRHLSLCPTTGEREQGSPGIASASPVCPVPCPRSHPGRVGRLLSRRARGAWMAVGCTLPSALVWQFRGTERLCRAWSPWGHRRVLSWGGSPQGAFVSPELKPSQTHWALQVRGCLPALGLCYYGQITCGTPF